MAHLLIRMFCFFITSSRIRYHLLSGSFLRTRFFRSASLIVRICLKKRLLKRLSFRCTLILTFRRWHLNFGPLFCIRPRKMSKLIWANRHWMRFYLHMSWCQIRNDPLVEKSCSIIKQNCCHWNRRYHISKLSRISIYELRCWRCSALNCNAIFGKMIWEG